MLDDDRGAQLEALAHRREQRSGRVTAAVSPPSVLDALDYPSEPTDAYGHNARGALTMALALTLGEVLA